MRKIRHIDTSSRRTTKAPTRLERAKYVPPDIITELDVQPATESEQEVISRSLALLTGQPAKFDTSINIMLMSPSGESLGQLTIHVIQDARLHNVYTVMATKSGYISYISIFIAGGGQVDALTVMPELTEHNVKVGDVVHLPFEVTLSG